MATLTVAELALIRLDMGDECSQAIITDAQIQTAWDAANADKCTAYARIAWWMYVRVKPAAINLANGGTSFSTATARLYLERYRSWAECAGIGMGSIQVGVLALDLDQPCPDGDLDCWDNYP